jgi:hypothetical protein
VIALEIIFWLCAALIVWTQLGYALALAALARLSRFAPAEPQRDPDGRSPGRGGADHRSTPLDESSRTRSRSTTRASCCS